MYPNSSLIARASLGALLFLLFSLSWSPSASAAPPWSAYHGATGATHQANFNSLTKQDYRLTSLSVHGSSASPRYSAIWVKRGGPAWVAFHGLSPSEYQTFFNTWTGNGFRPDILTGTGSGSSAVLAGIFVNDGKGFRARHNISKATFDAECKSAKDNGRILRWFDAYGTSASPQFCGVWITNTDNTAWTYSLNETSANYQKRYNAMGQQWARAGLVAISDLSGFIRYSALWLDNTVGGQTDRHGLTSSGYQTTVNDRPSGTFPIFVQAGGSGSSTRYATALATTDVPLQRQWTATGANILGLGGFETAMKNFMQANQVRGGQLAVARDGKLVYARGFTWAESGYPITQPTSLFRIASCSKPLSVLATKALEEDGVLAEADSVGGQLQIAPPAGRFISLAWIPLTVRHLMFHSGGWNTDILGWDPQFKDWDFVNSFGLGWSFPVSKYQTASYMATEMQFFPGASARYSNFGYSLLGYFLESRTGKSYEKVVKDAVFGPVGVTRPRIGGSLRSQGVAGEVRYHSNSLGVQTTIMNNTGDWVPGQYGGFNVGKFDAHGGWILSAPDFVKVLAAFDRGDLNPIMSQNQANDMWDLTDFTTDANWGSRYYHGWISTTQSGARVFGHNGAMNGTSGVILRRSDKFSVAFFFNKWVDNGLGLSGGAITGPIHNVIDSVTSWPVDQFPSVGIPAFNDPPVAVIVGTIPGLLNVDPATGMAVGRFDASDSYDPDGGDLRYRWVAEAHGDGKAEVLDPTDPETEIRFHGPDTYRVVLNVYDKGNENNHDSLFFDVVVSAEPGGEVRYVRGNGNGDGSVNVADPSFIANYVFGIAPATPPPCLAGADANGDGSVNIADPTFVANHLFGVLPATPPPAPYPNCGPAPAGETLPCESAPGCND